MEPNRLARLETPQTAYLISQFPEVEYLEAGHVAEWLSTRKDQLLILAKEERIGSSLAKTISIATAAIGAVCYATSPLAPLGAVLGVAGYIWAQVTDSSHTHTFNPLPFIRGGMLDVIGSMGHSEARKDFISAYDEFDQLKDYLAPVERQEYQMLRGHMALITEYLSQIESGKRFYAYRWICDQFILMRGAFPSIQQTRQHTDTIQFSSPLVDCDRIRFIQDASQTPQPRPLIQDAPPARIQDAPRPLIADDSRLGFNTEYLTPSEVSVPEFVTHRSEIPDNQIDILKRLSDPIPNMVLFGLGGSGKGMLVASALRKIKRDRPNCQIFYIDPKNYEPEHGYTEGICNVIKRKQCQNRPSKEIVKWIDECLDDYLDWARDKEEVLLVIDEGTVLGDSADKEKYNRIGTHILHVSSLAGAKKEKVWLLAQSPFVKPMGLNLTSASQLVNCCIVTENNTGVLKAWKRSSLIEFPSDEVLKELLSTCKIPKTKRVIFWGGDNNWYSMPLLDNFSAYDRDNDKPLGDALSTSDRNALRNRVSPIPIVETQTDSPTTVVEETHALKMVNRVAKTKQSDLDDFIKFDLSTNATDELRRAIAQGLKLENRTDLLEKLGIGWIAIPNPIEALKFAGYQDKNNEEIKSAWHLYTGQLLNDQALEILREKINR